MKIAICFSGLLRYWDFCSNFFERFNDYRDDVEFYFYLSTWKNENVWMFQGRENPRNDGVERVDLSKYKFLNEYQRIDDLSVKKIIKNKTKSNFKEYFARNISGVFELLNEQAIDFDSVLWSRPDHIFTDLDKIINTTKDLGTNQICGNGMYKKKIRDYYLIMHPSLTVKFQNIFNDYYIEENVPNPADFSLGNIIEYHNMDYKNIGLGGYLMRSNKMMIQKKGYPTYEVLNNLAQKNGYDWMFKNLFRISERWY